MVGGVWRAGWSPAWLWVAGRDGGQAVVGIRALVSLYRLMTGRPRPGRSAATGRMCSHLVVVLGQAGSALRPRKRALRADWQVHLPPPAPASSRIPDDRHYLGGFGTSGAFCAPGCTCAPQDPDPPEHGHHGALVPHGTHRYPRPAPRTSSRPPRPAPDTDPPQSPGPPQSPVHPLPLTWSL